MEILIGDIHAAETPDDLAPGEKLGVVYIAGQGFTPERIRYYADQLNNFADCAEKAAEAGPELVNPAGIKARVTEQDWDF